MKLQVHHSSNSIMNSNHHKSAPITRRSMLLGTSAVGVGSLVSGSVHAASSLASGGALRETPDPEELGLLAGGCTVTASDVQGPFWLNTALQRQDITEGYPGVPLRTYLRIHSAATCGPIAGAVVDV